MENVKSINEFFAGVRSQELPSFTAMTGISKITGLDDLKKFVKFIVPEDKYSRRIDDQYLKMIEIKRKNSIDNLSVRIYWKGGKLVICLDDIYSKYATEEKSFDYGEITKMSKYLRKLVDKYLS